MIKSFLVLVLVSFFSCLYVHSEILTGGIVYSVGTAREISFSNVSSSIDISLYKKYLYDEFHFLNLKSIKKKKFKLKGRQLTLYSDGSYSVRYRDIPNPCFYYDQHGVLITIGYVYGVDYPKKYIQYDLNGKLDSVSLVVSNTEQYMFDKNKKLGAHWIGNNCYDEKGELVMTRK